MSSDDGDDPDFDKFFDDRVLNKNTKPTRKPKIVQGMISDVTDVEDRPSSPQGLMFQQPWGKAVLLGMFIMGVGAGVTLDSALNTNPKDLASRNVIDRSAPNPIICQKYGASAMAFDERVFVSFNPFNIYVSAADVKPACVLRMSNVVTVLQKTGLLTEQEIQACKNGMNTWAYIGDLNDRPQLSCVFESDDAQNEFLTKPNGGETEDDDDIDIADLQADGPAPVPRVQRGYHNFPDKD